MRNRTEQSLISVPLCSFDRFLPFLSQHGFYDSVHFLISRFVIKMAELNASEVLQSSSTTKQGAPQVSTAQSVPKLEEIVTPEILAAILLDYNKTNNTNAELVDFEAKPGTVAGDNYMSIIYAVKMNLKHVAGGGHGTLSIMLKVLPKNEMRAKMINDGNIFLKDVYMYDKIIPEMEKFQRETVGLSDSEISAPWPKCYASRTDGKEDYLAMEDLKAKGYKMANRHIGLDFDHCKLVMEALARFHAVSYAMFMGDYDKILEKYPWLEETMYKSEKIPQIWKDLLRQTYHQQAEKLRESGEKLGADLMQSMYTDNYFDHLYKLVGDKCRWATIGHGDCWTNNLLFRYDEETTKPLEVKFVDYQVSRVASRAVDIHYFLHSSPQIPVLNEREKELEDIYFEEFTKFAKRLGVDVDAQQLTKENFEEEIESIRYYGMVSGFQLALVTSTESADVPEMETLTEDDMSNSDKNFFLKKMKNTAMEKVKNLAGVHLPRCREMQKYLVK